MIYSHALTPVSKNQFKKFYQSGFKGQYPLIFMTSFCSQELILHVKCFYKFMIRPLKPDSSNFYKTYKSLFKSFKIALNSTNFDLNNIYDGQVIKLSISHSKK